jgi:hypothetical protein
MQLWYVKYPSLCKEFLPKIPHKKIRAFSSHPHNTSPQDEPLPPYPQRLRPPSPWKHPPWTRIVSPRLPMSLLQAPVARACARCGSIPWLGRPNGTHRKIERWVEHRSWVAAVLSIDTTTNRRSAAAGIRSTNQDDTDGTSSIVLPCPSS